VAQQKTSLGFLKTTAIGGALFLLPLIVVAALIGQAVPVVMTIAEALRKVLPDVFETPSGFTLLIVLAIAILLLVCFAAGILARKSFGRTLSKWFERKLLLLFPKYAILKDQMADSIGGDQTRPQMKPVLVHFDDLTRIAFETDCTASGTVTVYLPGSPDPWAGTLAFVQSDRVVPLDVAFGDVVSLCEQLGRGSAELLTGKSDTGSPDCG
jgi:uncharacterized membrane protein